MPMKSRYEKKMQGKKFQVWQGMEPSANKMSYLSPKWKKLFGSHFKFKWDILHLVNRAHGDALKKSPEIVCMLDFIQNHSSQMRTGLAYTSMILSDLTGFRRPKLKSETRMVNFEFDQYDSFISNAKFFDHPQDKLLLIKYYILVSLTTKLLLQVAQKTDVSTRAPESVFLTAHKIMTLKIFCNTRRLQSYLHHWA